MTGQWKGSEWARTSANQREWYRMRANISQVLSSSYHHPPPSTLFDQQIMTSYNSLECPYTKSNCRKQNYPTLTGTSHLGSRTHTLVLPQLCSTQSFRQRKSNNPPPSLLPNPSTTNNNNKTTSPTPSPPPPQRRPRRLNPRVKATSPSSLP